MTLSNFDWTDKTSVRWFILMPTGHEGPYDLNSIKQRCSVGKLSPEIKIWAEGLEHPITAKEAMANSVPAIVSKASTVTPAPLPELIPEPDPILPPLPDEDLPPPPLPLPEMTFEKKIADKNKWSTYIFGSLFFLMMVIFGLYQWVDGKKELQVRRYPKMDVGLHERITKSLSFRTWDQKIFFKEFVPADLSQIWLVTSSFQECDVEADFNSVKGKLIGRNDDPVSFKSKGRLAKHVVELSLFDFKSGNKVIPGMYELDIKAFDCEWGSLASKVANVFRPVDSTYEAKTKVILFPKGASEFNTVLENLLKKKLELELKEQNKEEAFWQELQQSFQTLLAISLQIEQHFLDFLGEGDKNFKNRLPFAIHDYTTKYGNFLTNFLIANESYFQQVGNVGQRAKRRNYELIVKTTSKKIGHESMKFIERLQALKKPGKSQLKNMENRLKKSFSEIKTDINQKIIQVSEDRST